MTLRAQTMKQGMKPVIPPRKGRTRQKPYDEHLYKLRHPVENAFLHLKRWREHCQPIRQKQRIISCRHPDQVQRPLAQSLVTTLSRDREVDRRSPHPKSRTAV
jgi:hypothetical protein